MIRAFLYRIYPTPEQAERLTLFAGASRFIYNIALEQRRDWWRQYRATTGRNINWATQSREVTALRQEVSWLAEVPRSVCEQSLRDLEKAFSAFIARRAGYPAFRTRDRNMAFRVQGSEVRITVLNRKWASLRIPNSDPIKIRLTRQIAGRIKSATVRSDGANWFVSFSTEQNEAEGHTIKPAVGIDRGIANTFSLSNGEHHSLPNLSAPIAAQRRSQRVLSRRKKGSRRRGQAKAAAGRRRAVIAKIRNHWLHERSTDIAKRFGVVTLEALKVRTMTASGKGKRGLNREILARGWSIFASMLEYKTAERGGRVEYVNPAYTSQTCAECGSIDKRSRESQASFRCVDCGHTAHADTNAALNILRRSPAGVEGAGYGPVEARPRTMLTHWENLAA